MYVDQGQGTYGSPETPPSQGKLRQETHNVSNSPEPPPLIVNH